MGKLGGEIAKLFFGDGGEGRPVGPLEVVVGAAGKDWRGPVLLCIQGDNKYY